MSTAPTLRELLETRHAAAVRAFDRWRRLLDVARSQLGAGFAREQGFEEAIHQAGAALDALREAVEHPTLVLATTGTTSGGKSAFVNMLCAAELMPVAVQEKSAGAVIVEHDSTEQSIKVKATRNARWMVGKWTSVSAAEIRKRLSDVMDEYRALRDANVDVDPPLFHVRYPTRIGLHAETLGLPADSRVQILDLPGLSYVGDESNARIIRERCRAALSVVMINSLATDPSLRQNLVREVVTQVRALSSTPARMLFVANRIDAFRQNEDAETATTEFVRKLTGEIQSALRAALPEYEAAIQNVRLLPLSSEAALHALLLFSADPAQQDASLNHIDQFYRFLIPDSVNEDLPRVITRASNDLRARLARAVFEESHGGALLAALQAHVRAHLPELILPQLLGTLRDAMEPTLASLDSAVSARRDVATRRYQEAVERINGARKTLTELRDRVAARVGPLLGATASQSDRPMEEVLAPACRTTETLLGMPKGSLAALHDWFPNLQTASQELLNEVRKAILTGDDLDGSAVVRILSPEVRTRLERARKGLTQAGYEGDVAREGDEREAKGTAARAQLERRAEALQELCEALQPAMEEVLLARWSLEGDRIVAVLEEVLALQARELRESAERAVPELRQVHMPPVSIERIRERPSWDIRFIAHADVRETARTEKVGEKVQTKWERVWWTLFLWKRKTKEVSPIYGEVPYFSQKLPSVEDLCEALFEQFIDCRPEKPFLGWLLHQLRTFDAAAREFHERRLHDYSRRLDIEYRNVEAMRERDIHALEDLKRQGADAYAALRGLQWSS